MLTNDRLVTGNAHADGGPRGGWFVARFIDPEHGLRCRLGRLEAFAGARGDFELKLFRHEAGHRERKHFPFNRTATSLSMLVGPGRFEIGFCDGGRWQHVVLEEEGDYALWAPGVGHRWLASRESTVFTVRCPAVDATDQQETPADRVPAALLELWDSLVPKLDA
jgi:hypothetical protein